MIPEEQFKIIQNLNQSYYQDNKTIIYHGDNRIDLKKIPDESIDLIVTDPNYGIKFMGKKWDVDVPAVETWIECLRVLKPGAFAYIMSSPRQDVLSEMIVRIRQAGFDTNFTSLYHVYAQGMPKAMNMSRAVDKKLGFERKVIGQRQDILQKQAKDFERGYRKIKDSFDAGAPERNNGFITISADITAPESPEAKKLDGSYAGFQPKPALECIIQAQKPLDIYSILTITTSHTIKLIDELTKCTNVNSVESSLNQHPIVREYIAQKNVMVLIRQEAIARIGMVAEYYDLMDMLKSILEELTVKQDTNLNTAWLWKLILADLLGKTNKLTTKTATEQIIELRTLNLLLFQSIHDNTIIQGGTNQNGLLLNVRIVESIIESVLVRLHSLKQTSVQNDAGLMNSIEEERISVQHVETNLNQIIQKENIAVKDVITQPKVKVIIVAMKSLSEKSFTEQALFNGKGISWLDNCRIPYQSEQDYEQLVNNYKGGLERATPETKDAWKLHDGGWKLGEGIELPDKSKGRFPANLLVSDDALRDGQVHKSGDLTGQFGTVGSIYGVYDKSRPQYLKGNSVDSFSRYFDLDKWFEENLKKLPKEVQQTFPFLIVPKASKSERNEGCDETEPVYTDDSRHDKTATGCNNPRNRSGTPKINFHPTCKPLKLMNYLITLGSREGDIVLDPHVGSGTTCIAARMLNRFSIGIDMEESYLRDIAVPKLKEMAKQKSILDFGSD